MVQDAQNKMEFSNLHNGTFVVGKYGLKSQNDSTFKISFSNIERSVLLMLFLRVCNQLGPKLATTNSTHSGFLQSLFSNSNFQVFWQVKKKFGGLPKMI